MHSTIDVAGVWHEYCVWRFIFQWWAFVCNGKFVQPGWRDWALWLRYWHVFERLHVFWPWFWSWFWFLLGRHLNYSNSDSSRTVGSAITVERYWGVLFGSIVGFAGCRCYVKFLFDFTVDGWLGGESVDGVAVVG